VKKHFASLPQSVEELDAYYSQPDHHSFVALDGMSRLVGVLTYRDNLSSGARNGYMERVAIDPERQNQGLGSQFVHQAVEVAFAEAGQNYYKVTLGVVVGVDGWERTRHVYEKMGFMEVGVWRNHVVVGINYAEHIPGAVVDRQVNGTLERCVVRDAIWMDLMREEWLARRQDG
jgi:ribosomal protein S18 acetylase RimI-like enzyme